MSSGQEPTDDNLPGQGDSPPLPAQRQTHGQPIPEEAAQEIQRFMSTSVSMMGGMTHPLLDRITSAHIDSALELMRDQSSREYADRRHSRLTAVLFAAFIAVMVVGFTLALVMLDEPGMARDITLGGISFIGGLGGGYGLSTFQRR